MAVIEQSEGKPSFEMSGTVHKGYVGILFRF